MITSEVKVMKNFIGGKWLAASSGETVTVPNQQLEKLSQK